MKRPLLVWFVALILLTAAVAPAIALEQKLYQGDHVAVQNAKLCMKKEDAISVAQTFKTAGLQVAAKQFDSNKNCVSAILMQGYVGGLVHDGPLTVVEIKTKQGRVVCYLISALPWEIGRSI